MQLFEIEINQQEVEFRSPQTKPFHIRHFINNFRYCNMICAKNNFHLT